jgi:hypothetical protein
MTAVARFSINNKYPIILGDLLLSGYEQIGSRPKLPTIEDVFDIFPEGSGFVPSGLSQKISVVADNLVIGWAGSYIAAKTVIRDIYNESKIKQFTKESISKYFSSIEKDIWDQDVGFVGFVKDSHGIAPFGYNCKSLKTSLFGKVGLLGTGARDIEACLNQLTQLPSPRKGNPKMIIRALWFALSLSGTLLNIELATLNSLLNFYGGGYEIASYFNEKFQKLQGITFIFWTARIVNDEIRIAQVPRHAFSYNYSGDILIIRSVSFNENNNRASLSQTAFAVTPLYRNVTGDEISSLKIPTLNNKWLCNYFLFPPISGKRAVYCQVDYGATEERGIRFLEEKEKLVIAVKEDFIKQIADEMFRRFNIK